MDYSRKSNSEKLTAAFCIFFPLLWLYLPNLAIIYFHPGLKSLGLLLIVFCTIPLLLLLSKNLRQFWIWNLPFAAISGFYTAYIIFYQDIPYEGVWFALWNASGEVDVGITKYFIYYSLTAFVGFILYCICLCHPAQTKIDFSKEFKSYYVFASLVCVSVVVIITNFLSQKIPIQRVIDQSVILESYPYGMVGMLMKTAEAFSQTEHIPLLPMKREQTPKGREIYVFVLGEAVRYDDWLAVSKNIHSSLLTEPDIRIFNNVSAQANLTSIALPMIMSGTSTLHDALNHPLWMQFAKSVGCSTGWITNATEPFNYAAQNDFYDVNINRQAWAGLSGVVYDDVLLPEIQRTLKQGPQKLCLVVHFIGSHFDYRLRYRADYDKYHVNRKAYNDFSNPQHDVAFRNAYNNSLIQTNAVLEGIIAMLKKEDAKSFLIYTADHAESFDDDGSKMYFHGNSHPLQTELRVPFFVWANRQFQQHYPDKWKALNNNVTRKISTVQVVPTLMDALSINGIPAYLAPSLLQPYKEDVTRMVLLPSINLVTFQSLR